MRPGNWQEINPDLCKGCPDIQLDNYGYLCDVSCGMRTAYLNKEAGADAMLNILRASIIKHPTFLKNCRQQRKKPAKICVDCPFKMLLGEE